MRRRESHLAVIPARAGSKGLAGKNMRDLCGKPLIAWTIETAIDVGFFDKIVVTSDMEAVLDLAHEYIGEKVVGLKRPKRLSGDTIPLAPVILHALNWAESEFMSNYTDIWTLQATSPLRDDEDIMRAYSEYKASGADSLCSVTDERHTIYKLEKHHVRSVRQPANIRQATEPYFIGNGAIFITKKSVLTKDTTRIGRKPALYVMDQENSTDVHTQSDLQLAEFYMKRRLANEVISNW